METLVKKTKVKQKSIQDLALEFLNTRSEKSFAALYNRLKPSLVFYAKKIVKDDQDAEDVVSSSFANIWSKIEQYNEHYNFSTWAYKITLNEALMFKRKTDKLVSMDKFGGGVSGNKRFELEVAKHSGVSDDYLIQDVEWEVNRSEEDHETKYAAALNSMDKLQPIYKQIIIDREVNLMKYKEIADKYNMPENTVKIRILRARKAIVKSMNKSIN